MQIVRLAWFGTILTGLSAGMTALSGCGGSAFVAAAGPEAGPDSGVEAGADAGPAVDSAACAEGGASCAITTCSSGADCSAPTPYCNSDLQRCVECMQDSQCPSNKCDNFFCQ